MELASGTSPLPARSVENGGEAGQVVTVSVDGVPGRSALGGHVVQERVNPVLHRGPPPNAKSDSVPGGASIQGGIAAVLKLRL